MAPSRARFTSRSFGCSRSWRARSPSSLASRLRASFGSWLLAPSSAATRSMRSACWAAASRICRCWAMTAFCGFGSRTTGARKSIATRAAAAGRRDIRGRNNAEGTVRKADSASWRCRRTNRSVSIASSTARPCSRPSAPARTGPAEAGNPTASSSALDTRSPSLASASMASAVSPTRGRARTPAISRATSPKTGIAAPGTGADSNGANRASVHRTSSATTTAASAIHARRTRRRSHSRRRCGSRDACSARSTGSRSPARADFGSGGMTEAGLDGGFLRRRSVDRPDIRRRPPPRVRRGEGAIGALATRTGRTGAGR